MKKSLSIVLTIACILSLISGGAIAAVQSYTEKSINSKAEEFLFASAENMWLYKSNDLSAGTIEEVFKTTTRSSDNLSSFGLKAEELNAYIEDISFAQEKAKYFKEMRLEQNIQRNDFRVDYSFASPEIDGAYATVFAVEYISFHYTNFPDVLSEVINYYTVELMMLNNEWVVTGVTAENDEFDEAFKGTGFVAERADAFFAARKAELDQEATIDTLMDQYGFIEENQTEDYGVPAVAAANPVWYTYNANNATAYAYTYVSQMFGKTSWDKISTADKNIGKTFYNANFKEFASLGGDCQNFVSQCIWAGFNGSNAVNQIYDANTGKYSPIMDSSGNYLWRGTVPGSSANSASWTSCYGKDPTTIGFRKYIAGEYDSGDPDMIVTKGELSSSQNFSGIYTNLKGALLHVSGGGHAIIVTDVKGPSRDDVLFCGHTSDRKALSIGDMHGKDSIYYFIPEKIRVQNPPEVKITAALSRPVAVGTAITARGNTDITCASLQITVKSPSGSSYSGSATNARTVSRAVTLNEEGLYTITVTAKKTTTSSPVSYVYTIRTYSLS